MPYRSYFQHFSQTSVLAGSVRSALLSSLQLHPARGQQIAHATGCLYAGGPRTTDTRAEAVYIPERPGAFIDFYRFIFPRNVTENAYFLRTERGRSRCWSFFCLYLLVLDVCTKKGLEKEMNFLFFAIFACCELRLVFRFVGIMAFRIPRSPRQGTLRVGSVLSSRHPKWSCRGVHLSHQWESCEYLHELPGEAVACGMRVAVALCVAEVRGGSQGRAW